SGSTGRRRAIGIVSLRRAQISWPSQPKAYARNAKGEAMPLKAGCAAALAIVIATALSLKSQEPGHSGPMEVTHGKPYVMVMVNGRGPFRFIIDTGTGGQAIITDELAGEEHTSELQSLTNIVCRLLLAKK